MHTCVSVGTQVHSACVVRGQLWVLVLSLLLMALRTHVVRLD